MQIIAMLTMLTDHVGSVFFPHDTIMRIIGRIAFPIYAYCIVAGYQHTRSVKNYMMRLMLIGVLSQLPFMIALNPTGVNAVETLLVGLAVLVALDRAKKPLLAVLLILASCALVELLRCDYGAYGVLLVLAYRYIKGYPLVLVHTLLNVMFVLWRGWPVELFSIIPTLLIVYAPVVYRVAEKIRVPRIVWRVFYPAHLTILAAVVILVKYH